MRLSHFTSIPEIFTIVHNRKAGCGERRLIQYNGTSAIVEKYTVLVELFGTDWADNCVGNAISNVRNMLNVGGKRST